jgi:hypothetical protein
MPDFLLRNCSVVAAYPNEFRVILKMDDGYELAVGGISEATAAGTKVFWSWSCPGANGRSATREAAMADLKAAWRATDKQLAEIRHRQEWTANLNALHDAGYTAQIRRGEIHCQCGETFNPRFHEQTMAHISHITGRAPGTNPPPRA